MYKTNENYRSTSKPLKIRLNEIVPGKEQCFVNSVCSALIDSRFGPGRGKPIIVHLSDRPEPENGVFFEMIMTGPYPSYTILPDSEMARRYSEDIIKYELDRIKLEHAELEFATAQNPDLSPSPHGRGSP